MVNQFFQFEPQDAPEQFVAKQKLLLETVSSRKISISYHDSGTSRIEAILARGDRRLADVVEAVWRDGGRLEGWEDFVRWERSGAGTEMDGGWLYPDEDELEQWNEGNGSRERVAARIVDSRAAQHSKIQMREDKAFIDLLNELGMAWIPASGKTIGSGEQRVELEQLTADGYLAVACWGDAAAMAVLLWYVGGGAGRAPWECAP